LRSAKENFETIRILWCKKKSTYISLTAKVSELRGREGAEFGGKVNFSMNAP